MNKIKELTFYKYDDIYKMIEDKIARTDNAQIFKLKTGEVVKYFGYGSPFFSNSLNGIFLQFKICKTYDKIKTPEIVVPTGLVEGKNLTFSGGYTMPYIEGDYLYDYLIFNLEHNPEEVKRIFNELERVIKESDDIVFPDMLTPGNVIVDKEKKLNFIDFEGIQVGKYEAQTISPLLFYFNDHKGKFIPDMKKYENTKYKKGDLFTKELDIKSIYLLYCYMCLGINLQMYDKDNSFLFNRENKIYKALKKQGIKNEELIEKIFRIFDNEEPNLYLGTTIDKINIKRRF